MTSFRWQDADSEKLHTLEQNLRRSDRVSNFIKDKDTKELLDYFYLTDPDSDFMTQLGVLFIGKHTQRGRIMNPPVVQVIKYDQYGEKVNKWLWDDYTHNPVEIINAIWTEMPEWRESTEISEGMLRRNILAYPEKVLRELLANSLVHRPYTIKGDIFIKLLNPENADALRSWLHPLIDMGLVIGTDDHSKAKEYRVVPEILKNSQYKGRTSLKRIENYRLKELIIEDLKIYKCASITEIQKRIGEEIPAKKIWNQLNLLLDDGKISKSGQNRWVKYSIIE